MTKQHHVLDDWDVGQDAPLISLPLEIDQQSNRIDVTVLDGGQDDAEARRVWIEQHKGILRVHCYSANDEPLTVELVVGEIAKVCAQ